MSRPARIAIGTVAVLAAFGASYLLSQALSGDETPADAAPPASGSIKELPAPPAGSAVPDVTDESPLPELQTPTPTATAAPTATPAATATAQPTAAPTAPPAGGGGGGGGSEDPGIVGGGEG